MNALRFVFAASLLLGACGEAQRAAPAEARTSGPTGGECPAPDAGSFADGRRQIAMRADELAYGPCPAPFPDSCEMAVLEGDPKRPGLFTLRLKTPEPWTLPPHSHPAAERVTVLRGEVGVGFGERLDRASGRTFGPGDYYVNAPGVVHGVWTEGPVEVQITAIGPWKVHPVEPKPPE